MSELMRTLKQVRKQIDLISYSNYRAYFEDLFSLAKQELDKYSYIRFADDLGLGLNNIVFTIIKGKRKLMFKHVRSVSDALDFDAGERKFFASLVRLQNSSNVSERVQDFDSLLTVAGNRESGVHSKDALMFFSAWHHALIFEALEVFPQGANVQQLTKAFRVQITPAQVRESLELLLHMNLIECTNLLYRKKQKNISMGSGIPGYGVIRFHLKMIELARECLGSEFQPNERNVSSVTLAVSDEGAKKISETVNSFRKKIFEISNEDSQAQTLVQVNFQVFPLLENKSEESST